MSELSDPSGPQPPVAQFVEELAFSRSHGYRPDDLMRYFSNNRLSELESRSRPIKINGDTRLTFNPIHPNALIKTEEDLDGFRIDDPRIYVKFFERVPDVVTEDVEYEMVEAIQLAVGDYSRILERRSDRQPPNLLGGLVSHRRDLRNARKDDQLSLGLEQAAVAHNLCHLVGIPSVFLNGSLEIGQASYRHAFLLVMHHGQPTIFDPANPGYDGDENGRVPRLSLFPAAYTLSFISGASSAGGIIERNYDDGKIEIHKVAEVSYRFEPDYPVSFDAFESLDREQLEKLRGMAKEECEAMAVLESTLLLSDFLETSSSS